MSVESLAGADCVDAPEPQLAHRMFADALRGVPCAAVDLAGGREPLPVGRWTSDADQADDAFLDHCMGPTLDIGCGPGRMTARLEALGHPALGVDVVPEAVARARSRGVSAILRDVFARLPGEGRWASAILADGNVGIGGDPVVLLRRVHELLAPQGRLVAEVAPPGSGRRTITAVLECAGVRSRPFRWSVVGADAVGDLAAETGFEIEGPAHPHGPRWCAVLRKRP